MVLRNGHGMVRADSFAMEPRRFSFETSGQTRGKVQAMVGVKGSDKSPLAKFK